MSLDFLKKAVHLLVLWTAINLLRSCLTGMSQGDPDSDDGVSSTQEENQNQTNKKQTDGKKNARLPFPKKPTRHSTRVMLLAQPQPPTTQISSCIEQINSIGENAQSQEEMVISRNQLVPLVESNQFLYHFCFFTIMAQVDQKLLEGGPVMTQQAPMFLAAMRSLWILASSLDSVDEERKYFSYLKKRYIQLSEEIFGRQLETIGSPMGNLRFDPDAPQLTSPEHTPTPSLKSPPNAGKEVQKPQPKSSSKNPNK